jgi:hypothetical protein
LEKEEMKNQTIPCLMNTQQSEKAFASSSSFLPPGDCDFYFITSLAGQPLN